MPATYLVLGILGYTQNPGERGYPALWAQVPGTEAKSLAGKQPQSFTSGYSVGGHTQPGKTARHPSESLVAHPRKQAYKSHGRVFIKSTPLIGLNQRQTFPRLRRGGKLALAFDPLEDFLEDVCCFTPSEAFRTGVEFESLVIPRI